MLATRSAIAAPVDFQEATAVNEEIDVIEVRDDADALRYEALAGNAMAFTSYQRE